MTRYQHLVIDLLEGRITRSEEGELSNFLQTDAQGEEQMLAWKRAWEAEKPSNARVEALWQQFLTRVEPQPIVILPLYRRRVFRWVAAFLLLCSVPFTVFTWLRSTKTTAVRESNQVVVSQTSATFTSIVLPDSSCVTLNEGSVLTYASDFGQQERRVLLEGEAYFEVSKNPQCPFIVKADGCEVLVTGTRFNVSAYAENEQTTITLLEGSVQVRHPLFNADLVPGEKLVYTRCNNELTKSVCSAESSIAWMTGKMDFDKVRLEELLTRLSRLYKEPIVLEDTMLRQKDVHYFMDERYPLEEVLGALAEVYNLSIAKESTPEGVAWKVKVKE